MQSEKTFWCHHCNRSRNFEVLAKELTYGRKICIECNTARNEVLKDIRAKTRATRSQ